MLIDVSDVSTIPVEIGNKIIESFSALPKNVVNKIKSYEIQNSNDIMCAIEDYYRPSRAICFYDGLEDILEKHKLVCYHVTKVSSKSRLLRDGLKTNEWEFYCSNLKNFYMNVGFSEDKIQKAVDIVEDEYKRKYSSTNNIKAQLCFLTNLAELKRKWSLYAAFCENIGGELARWALKDGYPELYKPLKENGQSCVVKFSLPYCKIEKCEKESVAYKFVTYYAGVFFWNKEYDIKFDSTTQFDVLPEDILEIIDYEKELFSKNPE